MSYRLLILAVLVVVAAGALGWLRADVTPQVNASTRGNEALTLAGAPPSTLEADVALLTQRRPWGASQREAPPPQQATATAQVPAGSWRVGGILRSGQSSLVILIVQPQPNARHILRYLPVGDQLPDGRIIEKITGDSVHLRQGDRVSVLRLYSSDAG